jgi:hypothetical protein
MLTPEEINSIVILIRRSPLKDMQEAEAAAHLIQKLASLMPKIEPVKAKVKKRAA